VWTPTNTRLLNAILEQLEKCGKPTRYSTLWEAIQDQFGSKTTFNLYLTMLVKQGIVKREAKRKLPDGNWITVSRGRSVKYSLSKGSPLSPDASKERIKEWIESNFRGSKTELLTIVEHCLKGEGNWEAMYSEFGKKMKMNLRLWYATRSKEGFRDAVENILKEIVDEKRELSAKEQSSDSR